MSVATNDKNSLPQEPVHSSTCTDVPYVLGLSSVAVSHTSFVAHVVDTFEEH